MISSNSKLVIKEINPQTLFKGRSYCSVRQIETMLGKFNATHETILTYLRIWKQRKLIFPAGRGWYSIYPNALALKDDYVSPVVAYMRQRFPELDFRVWSTRQMLSYHHHLPMRYVTFVNVDRYGMRMVYDDLRKTKLANDVACNPRSYDIPNLSRPTDLIVVRPMTYMDAQEGGGGVHSPEGVLVDYAIESERLMLTDAEEYKAVVTNALRDHRVNVSQIFSRLRYRTRVSEYTKALLSCLPEEKK